MSNLMLIYEDSFVSEEWKRSTNIYIDDFNDYAIAFGVEMDYDDLCRLIDLEAIDFWIHFNGKNDKIDTRVGILTMEIEVSHLEGDEKSEAQELVDKYGLEEGVRHCLIKLVEKVQDFLVYEYEELNK